MSTQKTMPFTKIKYIFGMITLLFSATIFVAFSFADNDGFELAKQEIILRNIGHQLLLHAGDSTSRVLPVKKIGENEYQVRFENEFSFQSDSLVKIVRSSLLNDKLATGYIVNVRNCSGMDIVFGYSISDNKKNDIVPCSGRKQPLGCYMIEIKFEDRGISTSQKGYLIGGIPLLAFVGLLVARSNRFGKRRELKLGAVEQQIKIGNTLFDVGQKNLLFAGATINLTVKECKLLLILANQTNNIIERSRLQKEIWEDEGVIVGRSLDMFISKLRKKLEGDLSIQLKNIHGKGYRLEILEQ